MKNFALFLAVTSLTLVVASAPAAAKGPVVVSSAISEAEVLAAQNAWGEALVRISRAHDEGGQAQAAAVAAEVIDGAYGYDYGVVLFKPTLTHGEQTFRVDRQGALAYFVGGDSAYPGDSGFALKGWREFEIRNAAVLIAGDLALTMGNVVLVDQQGQVTTVDKTWGFRKDAAGDLRIVLHHSSLPYTP